MRHGKAFRKLGRNVAHRRATLRNLATSLVIHGQIETTLPKAKELKRVADKLVTLGKIDSLHRRRNAMKYLFAINRKVQKGDVQKLTAVHKLFEEIAPRYTERNGGYTRVIRTRKRDGDKAQMAIIQFVEEELAAKEKPQRRKRKVRAAKAEAETAPEASQVEGKAVENDQESAEQTGEKASE